MRFLPATASLRLRLLPSIRQARITLAVPGGSSRVRLVGLVLVSTLLSACGSAPIPSLYVLPEAPMQADTLPAEPVIAVADVALPAYARDRRMAIAGEGESILRDPGNRWASDPEDLISEALAQRLRARGFNAWTRPLPDQLQADYTLVSRFDTLLWDGRGTIRLQGNALLMNEGKLIHSHSFTIARPADGGSIEHFPAALGAALEEVLAEFKSSL